MQNVLFYTSKIIRPFIASPYVLCLVGIITTFVLLPAPGFKKKLAKGIGLFLIIILALFSTPAMARLLVINWQIPLSSQKTLDFTGSYDAVVVLGGSVDTRTSTADQLSLNGSVERLTAAAELYKAGLAPVVIVSGGAGRLDQKTKEAPFMAQFLQMMGVPETAIIQESESRNTFENALLTKKVMEKHGLRRIVLVTSAWHMRRAQAIFKKADVEFLPYSVDTLVEYDDFPADILPSERALDITGLIISEITGYYYYRCLDRL